MRSETEKNASYGMNTPQSIEYLPGKDGTTLPERFLNYISLRENKTVSVAEIAKDFYPGYGDIDTDIRSLVFRARKVLEKKESRFGIYNFLHYKAYVYTKKPKDNKVRMRISSDVVDEIDPEFTEVLDYITTAKISDKEKHKYNLKLPLRPLEFKIAKALLKKAPEEVSSEDLIYATWGEEEFEYIDISSRLDGLNVLGNSLKRKLDKKFKEKFTIEGSIKTGFSLKQFEDKL